MKQLIFALLLTATNTWADAAGPYKLTYAKGAIVMDALFTQGPSSTQPSTLKLVAYDTKTHRPVSGVIDVQFGMPAMDMGIPQFEIKASEPGVFTVSNVKLGMNGDWVVDVTFAPDGQAVEKQSFAFTFKD